MSTQTYESIMANRVASFPAQSAVILAVAALGSSDPAITGTLSMAKGFTIESVIFGCAWRLRLYKSAAFRTADLSRPFLTPLSPGTEHGCILDINMDPALTYPYTWNLSNEGSGSNADSSRSSTIYYAVERSSEAAVLSGNITINYLRTER